jgi:hypothetical protein
MRQAGMDGQSGFCPFILFTPRIEILAIILSLWDKCRRDASTTTVCRRDASTTTVRRLEACTLNAGETPALLAALSLSRKVY